MLNGFSSRTDVYTMLGGDPIRAGGGGLVDQADRLGIAGRRRLPVLRVPAVAVAMLVQRHQRFGDDLPPMIVVIRFVQFEERLDELHSQLSRTGDHAVTGADKAPFRSRGNSLRFVQICLLVRDAIKDAPRAK